MLEDVFVPAWDEVTNVSAGLDGGARSRCHCIDHIVGGELSLMHNNLLLLPQQFDAPSLRVLLLGGNSGLKSISTRFFETLTSLRILDLSNTAIENIPEAVFDLIELVLLNVDKCRQLQTIPNSIKRLQNLQQLQICTCNMFLKVPKSLTILTSLKVLDAAGTYIWDNLEPPSQDDVLEWSSEVHVPRRSRREVHVPERHNREEDGPKSMIEDYIPESLSKDDRCESSREDTATLQDVVGMTSLQSLSIVTVSPFPALCGQLTALQSLSLEVPYWKEVPETFTKLVHLKRLVLRCYSCTALPALDDLQHLEILILIFEPPSFEPHKSFIRFPDSFGRGGAFPSLQTFENLCFLQGPMSLQPGAMPRLKSFVIHSLAMEFPRSFRVLSTLTCLEALKCNSLKDLSAFEEPNSFPYLKEICFDDSKPFWSLPAGMLKSVPNLSRIDLRRTDVWRSGIPKDLESYSMGYFLVEKERQKQLEILTDD